jgi:hypothetical protein
VPRKPRSSFFATLVLLFLLLACPSPAVGKRRSTIEASTLLTTLEAGRPVVRTGVDVHGDLHLPRALNAPLILRDSRVGGDIIGAYGSFSRILDFSGSEIRGSADFRGARFESPFLFEGSRVRGVSSFSLAVFAEGARFGGARFEGRAAFSVASFDGVVSFASARFERAVTFSATEFGPFTNFSSTSFADRSDFSDARFGARADFIGATFGANSSAGPSVDFSRASFDGGATFLLADVQRDAVFALATSSGDMDFQGAKFRGAGVAPAKAQDVPVADFSTARFFRAVSFIDAELDGFVSFDQAVVADLDLSEAALQGRLRLPLGQRSRGRIGSLRLDLDDAERIDGPGEDDRPAQEAALALAESSARAADDLETANDARMRRLTIVRHRKGAIAEAVDFSVDYGIWGYGVRPFHQLLAIGAIVAVGTAARWRKRHGSPASFGSRLRGAIKALGDSLGTLLRLQPPKGGWNVFEYLVFKVLAVLLVLNAANVWPVSRELIEGIF